MKHGRTAVSPGSALPLSEAERVAIREMGKITMACERGEMTKDEALRRIAALVAADDGRIAQEKRARR